MKRAEALQAAEELQRAREVLVRGKWGQGRFVCEDGAKCALGALGWRDNWGRDSTSVASVGYLNAVTSGHSAHPGQAVVEWNDARGRTKAEVIAAFDTAASLALSEAEVLR